MNPIVLTYKPHSHLSAAAVMLAGLLLLVLAALGCAMDEADLRVRQSFAEHVEQFAGVAVPTYQVLARKGWESNHDLRRQMIGAAWEKYVAANTGSDGRVSVPADELLAEVANRDAALLRVLDSARIWREADEQFGGVIEAFRQTNRDLAAEELDVYERRKSVEASMRAGMEAIGAALAAAGILAF